MNEGKFEERELLLLPVGEFSSSSASLSTLSVLDIDGFVCSACVRTLIAVAEVLPAAVSCSLSAMVLVSFSSKGAVLLVE